jgi:hypothetical protein
MQFYGGRNLSPGEQIADNNLLEFLNKKLLRR